MMRRLAPLLLILAGCSLQPVYGGGRTGEVRTALSSIDIAPIPDRAGQVVREMLERNMGAGSEKRYRLEVVIREDTRGFGVRGDESITRERLSLNARYRLIDLTSNTAILEDVARSDIAIDVVRNNEFSVVSAEGTASERNAEQVARQILDRLGVFFQARK